MPPAAAPKGSDGLDLAAFQAAVSEGFVPLRVLADDPGFRGSLQQVTVGDVRFSAVCADPQTVERTGELIRRSPRDYVKISLQLEGASSLEQDDRRGGAGAGRPRRLRHLPPLHAALRAALPGQGQDLFLQGLLIRFIRVSRHCDSSPLVILLDLNCR